MTDSVFQAYSQYYDLLYRDKSYVSEVEYVTDILDRFCVSGKKLLEFGSGTGKHGRLLAARGYQVTGIERSVEMVAKVEETSGFSCRQGDICTVQLGQTFDAVLSLFHVMSYQTSNETVQAVFNRAGEHLEEGGLFVFDVWYSPAVYAQKPEIRVKRMIDATTEITRIAEPVLHPNDNRVDVNYTIFARDLASDKFEIIREKHLMRHFSIPELELFAKTSGFVFVAAEEFLTGVAPSDNTWGVCLVMQRT